MRKEYPLHEKRKIESRIYELKLILGKDEFERTLKEYLQDIINKSGIEDNVN
jgi:hypothetical protein